MDEFEVTLIDHKDSNGVSFGQWYLSFNKRHVGYVQKANGMIHYICQLPQEIAEAVTEEVKKQVGIQECTTSMVPKLPENYFYDEGEENEDSRDDFS